MTEFGPSDIAFVGLGRTIPAWYRCGIPANALGIEWVGCSGSPDGGFSTRGLNLITGNVMDIPDLFKKKVVVLQQPSGSGWKDFITSLRQAGVKVIYEVDDWLDSVRDADDHENRDAWSAEKVDEHYLAASACDGIIVSTDHLKVMYEEEMKVNFVKSLPIWVCRNGLDLGRYDLGPVQRDTVHIGWAGGVGHKNALEAWLPSVEKVMELHENTGFVSIGAQHGEWLDEKFPGRILRIPTVSVELFPAVMRSIDIVIGPARDNGFFRGKSDLRYLEASALGIPGVYDPFVYRDVPVGAGYLARSIDHVGEKLGNLVTHPENRERIGAAAQTYVQHNRSAEAVAEDWIKVFEEVTE